MGTKLKTPNAIRKMRSAGRIVAEVLDRVRSAVVPGVSTLELDRIAEELTLSRGGRPAFKGYDVGGRKFPAALCVSVNDEVVHGIPSKTRILQEGDIVGVDFGVLLDGYYGDAAVTLPVGEVSSTAKRLIEVSRNSLQAGIEMLAPGNRLGDVGSAVQKTSESAGYSVVTQFVGHGIGTHLHEDPQVPNYGRPGTGRRLREGMVLAVEPMVNVGGADVVVKDDGWTAVTKDGSLSAHFEHSIAITANGPEVLTVL